MTLFLLCKFFILFSIKSLNSLQDNNFDLNLPDVDIDNPLIQFNEKFTTDENEALSKASKIFSLNNSEKIPINQLNRPSDFSCYTCTSNDDSSCENVNLTRNSEFVKKCKLTESYCSVLRIEYKIAKEENWTLWILERSCLETCEPICIKLGERTRLKFCQTCCNESQCNVGNHGLIINSNIALIFTMILVFLFRL